MSYNATIKYEELLAARNDLFALDARSSKTKKSKIQQNIRNKIDRKAALADSYYPIASELGLIKEKSTTPPKELCKHNTNFSITGIYQICNEYCTTPHILMKETRCGNTNCKLVTYVQTHTTCSTQEFIETNVLQI